MSRLTDYRTLGRSGLVISPLTLGTMTFGAKRWGAEADVSLAMLEAYLEAGGNSIDTANVYSGGQSEEMIGRYIAERGLREKVILATKSGFSQRSGDVHAGGNGSKNIRASLENSLRRLQTDYIDLYWVHMWDGVTPAEEVLRTVTDLIAAGKIRYFGLSNTPAWYTAKMATLAQVHGVPGPIALQMEYSLTERAIEREHIPAALEFGIGVLPWSPLAGGFLTGKYDRETAGKTEPGQDRLSGANPFGKAKFTDRNWAMLDVLKAVAEEAGRPPAQVALAWANAKPAIAGSIIGVSKPAQLADNLASLEITLTPDQMRALDDASALDRVYPYAIYRVIDQVVFGGHHVAGWGD